MPELAVVRTSLGGPTGVPLSEALATAHFTLLTVDIWDTLIARTRCHAAPKLSTARRIAMEWPDNVADRTVEDLYDHRVRIEWEMSGHGANEDYEAEQVIHEQLRGLGIADARSSAGRLYVREVAEEAREVFALDPDLAALPEVWPGPVAMVSDFYLREASLRSIVACAAPAWADVPLFVSCEQGTAKRTDGGLFEVVRHHFGVAAGDHLHLGDNPHADFDNQVSLGGHAIQVAAATSGGVPIPPRSPGWEEDALGDLARTTDPLAGKGGAYGAGVRTALLAVALVARGAAEALRRHTERVCFVSREGRFLVDVWDACIDRLDLPGTLRPVWLEVSRRATFAPSLERPYRYSMRRMWTLYDTQSPRALLVSCGLDADMFDEAVSAAGLALDEKIEDIPLDPRVMALLETGPVAEALDARVREQRVKLIAYLGERGALDDPTMVVVDIGWRGTIQDNLAHVVPDHFLCGVYLGLFGFLNDQPANTSKVAVAFDCNQDDDASFMTIPAVIERPWTPDIPSVVGFVPDGREGTTTTVRERERGDVAPGVAEFQRGVCDSAPLVADWIVRNGLGSEALQALCHRLIEREYTEPSADLAALWFESDHDDTFGALTSKSDVPDENENASDDPAEASGWPEGYRVWIAAREATRGGLGA